MGTGRRQNIKNFMNKPVKIIASLIAPVKINNWSTIITHFVIVENGLRPLIGQGLFEAIGIYIKQPAINRIVYCINTPISKKQRIAEAFPRLINRIGWSKNDTVKSNIHKNCLAGHQKIRKVPIDI